MLTTIIIALIVIALLVYGATLLSPPLDATIVRIIQAAIVLLGALWIAHAAGLA